MRRNKSVSVRRGSLCCSRGRFNRAWPQWESDVMRVPPLYLACAVMFWAWHAQVLLLGVAMAALVEAPRVVRARWRFGPAGFARIADLCTWAFVILAGYLTFTKGMPLPILEIFQW